MADPILDLTTLAPERQTVRILTAKKGDDGKPLTDENDQIVKESRLYEMRTPDDLSLTDQQWFMGRAESLFKFGTESAETEEGDLLLSQALDKIMIDLPAEVAEQLPRPQRWKVVAVFLMPFVDELMPIIESAKGTRFEKLIPNLSTTES